MSTGELEEEVPRDGSVSIQTAIRNRLCITGIGDSGIGGFLTLPLKHDRQIVRALFVVAMERFVTDTRLWVVDDLVKGFDAVTERSNPESSRIYPSLGGAVSRIHDVDQPDTAFSRTSGHAAPCKTRIRGERCSTG